MPRFASRGSGPWIWDTEGRRYLDFVCSWGPLVLGHAFPAVVSAVSRAAERGTTFGAPTAAETELAELVVSALPSTEQVRLVSSGTEAAMTAIRLARGCTGRARIIKFDGCYHGHSDGLLVRSGSGALTFGHPDSAGVPGAIAELTMVAAFNDLEGAQRIFAASGTEIAAVIVEPIPGNMGTVLPEPGFLEGLRELTRDHGALLIFDEVITGFRVAWGGAQTLLGVQPDITCLGKIIGGGLPMAAVAGPKHLMEKLTPLGSVYQAGTLSGNPIAVAAGLATLRELEKHGTYARLDVMGGILQRKIMDMAAAADKKICINRAGSMWTLFLGVDRVRCLDDAMKADAAAFGRFFHGLIKRGFYLPPSQFETAFISLAHTESDIDELAGAVADSLCEAD